MANIDGVKIKRPRKTLNLCRICLTYSPSLKEMSDNFEKGFGTIQEILEEVMCCEILFTQKTPHQICAVCLSVLKISYNFKKEFEASQKKLFGNLTDKRQEADINDSSEVELIFGNNNFSLKDVVIVDNDEKDEDYSQFLNNLGKTVTIEYSRKSSLKEPTYNQIHDTEYKDSSDFIISDTQSMDNQIGDTADNEGYETIIIECVSDTEEPYSNLDNFTQNSYLDVRGLKNSASLGEEINSFISEDNGDEQQVVKNIEIENSTKGREETLPDNYEQSLKPKRKRRGSTAKMKEIEKYIIYESEDTPNGILEDYKENSRVPQNTGVDSLGTNENNVENDQNNWTNNENILLNHVVQLDSEESWNKLEDTGNDEHVCKRCSMSFNSERLLKRHLVSAHRIQKNEELRHRKSTRMPREVKMIRRIQRLKERYKANPMLCQICGYVSKSSGGARYHSLTHGEKNYECDLCSKKFFTPNHLKNHLQYKHERRVTKHLCSVCGEYRNSSSALVYHMKLHTQDAKKFPCPICDITFLVKNALTNHIRRHLGERRFPCNICDKSFFSSNERKKHMMVHTGERPHKCEFCEKRFGSTFNQKIHMMTHTGPHLCKICLRGFVNEEMLKLHSKYRHCTTSSNSIEAQEDEKPLDSIRYESYEQLIQSPGSGPDDVVLEDFSLLDAAERDDLNFDNDD